MPPRLPIADAFPPDALQIVKRLHAAGHDAVIVGGPVRDFLRGSSPSDVDIATSAPPPVVRALFTRTFVQGRGERHGTIGVLGGDNETYEVTTFRADVETDGRHATVAFTTDLRTDLERRDFTVNAMALRPVADGLAELVDPFGGQRDLQHGQLRAVGDADRRFQEDHLRVLRAYRFAARYGFAIAPATRTALRAAVPGLRSLSAERVRDEFTKLFAQATTPGTVRESLTAMQRDGVLAVVLPELDACVGVGQNVHHAFDVFTHIASATDAAPASEPWLRWVLLLHDIGKPASRTVDAGGYVRFIGHEVVGAEMADSVLRRLAFPTADRERIVEGVRQHMRLIAINEGLSPRALRRIARSLRAGLTLDDLLTIRIADKRGSGLREKEVDGAREAALRAMLATFSAEPPAVSTRALAIDGRDVMTALGCRPGPVVGLVLERLLDRVVDDPSCNTREALLAMLPLLADTEARRSR